MNKETLGTLLAIITALISGVAIPANKVFVVSIDPAIFTAVRSIIIGAVFFLLSVWLHGRNKEKRFISAPWKYLAGIAVVGGSIAFLLYFTGLKLTTAGRAAFLHKTLPIYTAVFAFLFLKEKITRRYIIAIVVMLIGMFAIYFTSINPAELWSDPKLGDMLVVSATVLWGAENVIARKAMKLGEHNFIVSFSRMFFGGLILSGVVILTGKTGTLLSLSQVQIVNILISTIILLGYVFFYYWSLRLINVSKAATLLLIAPVVSLVLGIVFLGEPAPITQIAGSIAILAGAYMIAGMKSEERGI